MHQLTQRNARSWFQLVSRSHGRKRVSWPRGPETRKGAEGPRLDGTPGRIDRRVCLHEGRLQPVATDELSGRPPQEGAPRRPCALVARRRGHHREPHSGSPGSALCAGSIGTETYQPPGIGDSRRRRITFGKLLLRCLLSLHYMLDHPHPPWFPTDPEKVAAFKKLQIQRRILLPRRKAVEPCDTRARGAVFPNIAEPIFACTETDP